MKEEKKEKTERQHLTASEMRAHAVSFVESWRANSPSDALGCPQVSEWSAATKRVFLSVISSSSIEEMLTVLGRELPLLSEFAQRPTSWFSFAWLLQDVDHWRRFAEGQYRVRDGETREVVDEETIARRRAARESLERMWAVPVWEQEPYTPERWRTRSPDAVPCADVSELLSEWKREAV